MNQPYPNLADVPPEPAPTPKGAGAAVMAQAHTGVSAPNPGALAGLTLPAAAPPPPPGVVVHAAPAPAAQAAPAPAPVPNPPPVSLGFVSGSALLTAQAQATLRHLAATRGDATLTVCGFGEGSLTLALERTWRLAAALTAAGVPGSKIHLTAMAPGSGGFVQLVY